MSCQARRDRDRERARESEGNAKKGARVMRGDAYIQVENLKKQS